MPQENQGENLTMGILNSSPYLKCPDTGSKQGDHTVKFLDGNSGKQSCFFFFPGKQLFFLIIFNFYVTILLTDLQTTGITGTYAISQKYSFDSKLVERAIVKWSFHQPRLFANNII